MKKLELVSQLKQIALLVARLYVRENDEIKKQDLEKIHLAILEAIEHLESDNDNDDGLLASFWSELKKQIINHGLDELFDQLAGLDIYLVKS